MNKTKIAICMKDLEYQERFVNCFMNHYNRQYELHVFTSLDQLQKAAPMEYAVIITEEYTTEEMADFVEKGKVLLNLTENFEGQKDALEEKVIYTEKYQEVYKIVEHLESMIADIVPTRRRSSHTAEYECIGVYSLTREMLQVPFVALLGKIFGVQQKTLVLDLQNYSGLGRMEEGMASMGLEDMLSAMSTGNYSRSRMLECIRHEPEWDYICSAQNNQCLAEGNRDLYMALIELLVQEMGYQKIIINFGSAFLGQLEMMEQCKMVYLLCGKEREGHWREDSFFHELLRLDKECLMQKIRKTDISQSSNCEENWNALAEKWSWGPLGDLIRRSVEREKSHGTAM